MYRRVARFHTICPQVMLFLAVWLLSACVNGIPPPDGWQPKPVKPCDVKIIVYPDKTYQCLTKAEFREWLKRNLPNHL